MADVPVKYYNQAKAATGQVNSKWWAVKKEDRARHIFGVAEKIWEYQKYREFQNLRYARLYHNMDLVSLRAGMFAKTAASDNRLGNRVTLNVIKSCVDTVSSKIAKNKPRPMFLTSNGSWGLQNKAKLLTKYMEGLFDHQGAYETMAQGFVDSAVWGTGVMKIFRNQQNQIDFERVIGDELVVDETEGRYKKPRQMFQVKLMFRDVLCDMFPDYKRQIMAANSGLTAEEQSTAAADMIKVVEAWHLPSGPNAKDGRKSIVIENQTLDDEEYTKDYFPFVIQRWTPKLLGFYGMGLAEELLGIQLEINKILRNIQIAQHLCAVPQVWLEANSHVVKAHLNNEIGGVKNYVGTPPIFMVPQAMSPEVYSHLENLYKKAFEITGISQLSASAKKPSGVTAAVAMRELSDIESERFMLTAQRYEECFMEATKIAIDMTRDLYEDFPDLTVKVKDGKFLRQIKWKECDLDENMYTMRVFPTSLLPTQPAGKLQKVQEMLQAGFLDKDEALSLLDFPDTNKVTMLKTAARDNLSRIIDLMLEDGKYTTPEPFMNLQLGLQLAQNAYNEAQTQEAPEDRLDLLRRFMDEINAMLAPAQTAQIQTGMTPDMMAGGVPPEMGGVMPQAVPQALPVSELLPMAG